MPLCLDPYRLPIGLKIVVLNWIKAIAIKRICRCDKLAHTPAFRQVYRLTQGKCPLPQQGQI